MLKTFAIKYRTNVNRIKARFIKNGQFTVTYETKSGKKKPYIITADLNAKRNPLYLQTLMFFRLTKSMRGLTRSETVSNGANVSYAVRKRIILNCIRSNG